MRKNTSNTKQTPYNGHPNWQLWNVSLWLSNDYEVYQHIMSLIAQHGKRQAAHCLWEELKGQSTPDGALYTKAAIRYAISDL